MGHRTDTTRRGVFAGAIAVSAAAAVPIAAQAGDDQLLSWDRQRHLLWSRAEAIHDDEDELARLCDAADVFDDLIRAAPCKSRSDAIIKLASLRRDVVGGERYAARPASEVIDEIVAYLRAV